MAARLRLPELWWPALVVAAASVLGVAVATRPLLTLTGVVALGLAAVMVANLTIGLCVFTLVSFVDVLPGGPALSAAKAVGLILALTWLATVATRDDERDDFFSAHPGAVYLLVLFFSWAAISALWAQNEMEALTTASRYGLNLILFPIVYTAVYRQRHVWWIAAVFVAGAVLTAAFGVVFPQPTEEGRLAGAVGEANELASVLVAALAVALALAFASPRYSLMRRAALAASVVCLGGILFTLSRSGLLALAVVLLVGMFLAGRWRGRALLIAAAAAVCALVYVAAFTTPYERDRLTRVQGGAGRVDLWRIGWRMAEDKPLTGVGGGNYQLVSPQYLLTKPGAIVRDDFILERPKQTHNIYLQTVAELGIPGLLLLLSVIGFALLCMLRAARIFDASGNNALRILSLAFLLASVGLLASDFFQSEQYSKQLWLVLALGPALLGLAVRERERLA
jgi:O-antigen ligase